MRRAKIVVLGRNGQVGWELGRKLKGLGEVVSLGSSEVDLSKPAAIREMVHALEPTVLVNAAAYTSVDKAESDAAMAEAVNGVAPGVLAEEAKEVGCLLVHFSTDYVFDGTKQGVYDETDEPNPINVYGKTKLAGELAIEAVGGAHLILRTSWVYGARGSNFLLTVLRLAQEREELCIVDDQVGAPTSSACIAQTTAGILARVLAPGRDEHGDLSGTYNLTSKGETSWYGFAKATISKSPNRQDSTKPKVIPVSTLEFPRPARRPANSRLSCNKLEKTFGVELPHWESELTSVLATMSASSEPA